MKRRRFKFRVASLTINSRRYKTYLYCRFVIMTVTLQLRPKFRVTKTPLVFSINTRPLRNLRMSPPTRVTRNLRRNWSVIIIKRQRKFKLPSLHSNPSERLKKDTGTQVNNRPFIFSADKVIQKIITSILFGVILA